MIEDKELSEIYFELPDSSIKGIPIYHQDKKINFGFVEIGCKPDGKRAQLRDKKELFYRYWAEEYKKRFGLDWFPNIFRMLAHYDPTQDPRLNTKKVELDVTIFYQYITPEMISSLTQKDKQGIYSVIAENKKNILEEIIETSDAARLHSLITLERENPQLSNLRGKFAEVLVLKDIFNSMPFGISLYRNGDIKYFNKRYDNGTEIDGILTFYDQLRFETLVERLSSLEHVVVKHR